MFTGRVARAYPENKEFIDASMENKRKRERERGGKGGERGDEARDSNGAMQTNVAST